MEEIYARKEWGAPGCARISSRINPVGNSQSAAHETRK